ncbi:MAG: T9SS type A sorting domain-containing protein [Chitinophagaceae bacterium]|nr:T9SS type A sorting domain-containing protein [Chitinophagaceae bacterium]
MASQIIRVDSDSPVRSILIFSVDGKLRLQNQFQAWLNYGNLQPGSYFVTVATATKKITRMIIIQ